MTPGNEGILARKNIKKTLESFFPLFYAAAVPMTEITTRELCSHEK
jgi:hypothetical protein